MSIRSIALAMAAAAAFAVPAAATAAETTVTTAGVQYKDLDLTSEAGQKELQGRLDKAAREVCGMDEDNLGSRVRSRESRECYREARQKLGEQMSRLVKNQAAAG